MPRTIILLTVLMLLTIPCRANAPLQPVTDLPFSLEKGFVIVEATIKRDVTVNVILGTGVEHSIMDPGLLQKYELSAAYTSDGPVMGRPTDSTYSFTMVSGVKVGDSKSKRPPDEIWFDVPTERDGRKRNLRHVGSRFL